MEKLDIIMNALEDINASDIVTYNMKEVSPFYDYMVIASVGSTRGLQAAIRHISDDLNKAEPTDMRVEGKDSDSWVLIDTKDVIVNVFTKEERVYYDIEKVLAGVPKVKMDQ
jgi:ribosome-associated protein